MTHDARRHIGEIYFALCKSVSSPVALSCWMMYSQGDHSTLASHSIDPAMYRDARSFAGDYLVTEFLSKWKGLQTGLDTSKEGIRKFKLAEEKNRITNDRVINSRSSPPGDDVASVLYAAQRIISRILSPFDRDRVLKSPKWSPGATATLSRRDARVDKKMLSLPISVTPRALPIFREVLHDDLHWCAAILGHFPDGPFCFTKGVFEVTECNRIVTVPKNAKTDRVIAAEPTANIYLQKAVGGFIRNRLKRFGVDLDDQTRNQDAARIAHTFGLATIDLSMASDTISRELVFDLLPVDWALFLDDLRSPKGKFQGEVFTYSKFSSMGNAFTFELESLIFYAICEGCARVKGVHCPSFVYGDDLVIPEECYPLLTAVLQHCGFEVNASKSHVGGQFYESCGKHYFSGIDVTPVYQKEIPTSLPDWIRLGNRLIRSTSRYPFAVSAWHAARRFGGGNHFAIPWGVEGDDGWVMPRESYQPVEKCRNRGFKCRVIRMLPKRERVNELALLALRLRSIDERPQDALSHLPREVSLPFDGTVTRDLETRWRPSSRWVIPSWAEEPDLR